MSVTAPLLPIAVTKLFLSLLLLSSLISCVRTVDGNVLGPGFKIVPEELKDGTYASGAPYVAVPGGYPLQVSSYVEVQGEAVHIERTLRCHQIADYLGVNLPVGGRRWAQGMTHVGANTTHGAVFVELPQICEYLEADRSRYKKRQWVLPSPPRLENFCWADSLTHPTRIEVYSAKRFPTLGRLASDAKIKFNSAKIVYKKVSDKNAKFDLQLENAFSSYTCGRSISKTNPITHDHPLLLDHIEAFIVFESEWKNFPRLEKFLRSVHEVTVFDLDLYLNDREKKILAKQAPYPNATGEKLPEGTDHYYNRYPIPFEPDEEGIWRPNFNLIGVRVYSLVARKKSMKSSKIHDQLQDEIVWDQALQRSPPSNLAIGNSIFSNGILKNSWLQRSIYNPASGILYFQFSQSTLPVYDRVSKQVTKN